jgi:glutamate-1-semialdehyde 2,1-aminomutase
MRLCKELTPLDRELVERRINDFVPARIYDIHAHLLTPAKELPLYLREEYLGWKEYLAAIGSFLPGRNLNGLFFGFPVRNNDRTAINQWLETQIRASEEQTLNRGLLLVSPEDDPRQTIHLLAEGSFIGLKPYHCYAPLADTTQARVEDFVPEWMWEACDASQGVLMLHIMKERASADEENLSALRRLCGRYPRARVILAHVGRSFSYRTAREGLPQLCDLENLWVDTSAVTESETFRCALETLGPRRMVFGSDFPISQLRGRCVATGKDSFSWFYAGEPGEPSENGGAGDMTLIGIESLLCLREAAEDCGLGETEINDIFLHNALRLLDPHLPEVERLKTVSGPDLWRAAKTKVSCGTGLRSKWAELYDPRSWPSYFSRCSGCDIWDLNGRHYRDFGAGAGAIVLGYSDPDVNRAVKRRIDAGSYCQLLSPEELALADLLLELHPWAGRVRYARGGGDAMAVAVRIARAATGKSGIAFCGYHGWHDWYLSANLADESSLDGHLLPGLQPLGVPRELSGTAVPFRFNDWASFESALERLEGRLAAVVLEPMRTQFPHDGFLEKIAERCRQKRAVFILDEITSGWRFGFPGAHTVLGIQPDVAVYAKAISNGFPCAAIIGRGNVMDAANPSFISSSYWTDGVGPAAALASIRKMRALNAQARVWELGATMQQGLSHLAERYPTLKMKSWGLPGNPYMTFDLGRNSPHVKALIVRRMLGHGFLSTGGASFIMFAHNEQIISEYLEALDTVLAEICKLAAAERLSAETGAVNVIGQFARLT